MSHSAKHSALLLMATILTGCQTVPLAPPPLIKPLGLIELTIRGLGTGEVSASLQPVGSSLTFQALTPLPNGLQARALTSSAFDVGTRGAGGQRYLSATFEIRNASNTAQTAYPEARQNLTFFAASSAGTLQGTAVTQLVRFDASPANPNIALTLLPTHGMEYRPLQRQALVSSQAADFQVFTEIQADPASWMPAGTPAAMGLTSIFPYGFVVRQASGTGRALPANPGANQWDGRVTFAYRMPLQSTAAADPYQIRILMQAVEDTTPRVTESLEEQTTPGSQTVTQRAGALQATLPVGTTVQVATLSGTTYAGANKVAICRVRTAGTAAAPTTYLGSTC